MLQDLKDGKFVLINGVFHTLTPLNNIDDLEKEARQEVEMKVRSEMASEQLIRELGRAGEFFTENNWRYHFIEGDLRRLILVAPFEGGVMEFKKERREYKLYIPNGWVGLRMEMSNFPNMSSEWIVMPRMKDKTLKETWTKYSKLFHNVHPHTFGDGKLCGGMTPPPQFNIDVVVQMIKDIIIGSSKDEGTSIWDYNKDSPATDINLCTYGKMAYKMHKEDKSDDEIWKEIIKAQQEKRDMGEYIDGGEE